MIPLSGIINLADLGCRGCQLNGLGDIWRIGPEWLEDVNKWPEQIKITANTEAESEAKIVKKNYLYSNREERYI